MSNELQVKPPKPTFVLFEQLLTQAMMKTNSRRRKLLYLHQNPELRCLSAEPLLERKKFNQKR